MARRQARRRLNKIFGKDFVEKELKDNISSFSKVKYLRNVRLSSTYLASPEVISDILFEESMRVLNQHSIRLLLEDPSGSEYQRPLEDE